MNKQQLASKIWESANRMRSKIPADQYKDYILGFMFYKFLSDKEVAYLKETDWTDEYLPMLTEDSPDTAATAESVRKNIGYFISYEYLFSTWIKKGNDFKYADVSDALSAFSQNINPGHKKLFEGIFRTLETGLSNLGATAADRTKAVRDLVYLINQIPMGGRQDYDVLGFIYEYLIGNFAANAGKKAGEFYTPHEVSQLMSDIVAQHLCDRKQIKIYDPTSGSGSLLINIGRSAAQYMGNSDGIMYYAQELKQDTYNLTRMNLVMRGINVNNIVTRNGDTLEDDWPYFDDNDPVNTYDPLYVDAVVSNPPYSQKWEPAGKENDPRYKSYGLAPQGKADYAFLLHDLYHLKPDGIMTIVLPHGVLFRGGTEKDIREALVEHGHIDAIIGLPANIFFGTGIPTIVMVLKQKRADQQSDVLIIDASKGFAKEGKNNKLRARDIKRIIDTIQQRKDVPGYARVVGLEELRANDYNLNIPRYVDSSEKGESWDLYATMYGGIPGSELQALSAYWNAFPGLKEALFHPLNEAYYAPAADNLQKTMEEYPSVQAFLARYTQAFQSFAPFLQRELIDHIAEVPVNQEEAVLSDDIFRRLSGIPMVDPYEAYQMLDDRWQGIEGDLEILQTEGMDAVRKVDPHMILKKVKGKETEVQDGWIGRILPFELVQKVMLTEDVAQIEGWQQELESLAGSYEGYLDELPEEERDKAFVDDNAFVPKEVKKALKEESEEPEILAILRQVQKLENREKKLKKDIKQAEADLETKTKALIESISDEEAKALLQRKWIQALQAELEGLPGRILSDFAKRLEALKEKYAETFSDIEDDIEHTEKELCAMLQELRGNAFDEKALKEFQKLLGGGEDESIR